jgi:hypothetical protein
MNMIANDGMCGNWMEGDVPCERLTLTRLNAKNHLIWAAAAALSGTNHGRSLKHLNVVSEAHP